MSNYSFGGTDEPTFEHPETLPTIPPEGAAVVSKTIFDTFKEAMNHPAVKGDEVTAFKVDERPGISVEYSVILDYDVLNRYVERHTNKRKKMNTLNFSFDILTLLNRGFRLNGENVTEDGEPLSFVSDKLLKMCGVSSSREAIRWMYGLDSAIIVTAAAVLEACGYSDVMAEEDDEANPTSKN